MYYGNQVIYNNNVAPGIQVLTNNNSYITQPQNMQVYNNQTVISPVNNGYHSQSTKKKPILNNVKNRLLILSPAVAAGLEREANKNDFESLDDKSVGRGGFGSVWKVRHKVTKQVYAIKVINKDNIIKQNMVEQTNREIQIMYKLDHPHIISGI